MNIYAVSLGSNIQPALYIGKALEVLRGRYDVRSVSSVRRTAPVGFLEQEDFSNTVAVLACEQDPETLRLELKQIEKQLGRQSRENRWGPREIDLDVLVCNGRIVDNDYFERDFLRELVAEVIPDLQRRCC